MTEARDAVVARGAAALERADWAAARDAFQAALDEAATPEALNGLGTALWWTNDLPGSVTCREQAYAAFRRRGDLAEAALIACLLVLDYRKQYGNAVASAGWLSRASRLIEDGGVTELQGWLLLARAYDSEDPSSAEQLAREAGTFARQAVDNDLELCALSQVGAALIAQGRVDEGVRCLDEALAAALGGEGTMPDTVVFTSCQMMTSCTQCSDFVRAAHWVHATMRFTAQYGCPFLYAECRIVYGTVLLATGQWVAAEKELMAGLALARDSVPTLHRQAIAGLAELRLAQGRLDEAERLVAGLEDHAQTVVVVARLHLARGRPAAAASTVRRRLATTAAGSLDSAPLVELLGEALLAEGDAAAAALQAQTLLGLGSGAAEVIRGRGERLLGRAAAAHSDVDAARTHLDAALVAFVRLEMRHDAARTRLSLAEALRGVEPEVSEAEARAALAAFEHLGAGPDADAAAALLRGLGVRAARTGPRGSATLTKREDEVFRLLGEGLSNPEIAARLFLSRKTVEHHVASVLAKLGLRSRSEAAARAAQSRIAPRLGEFTDADEVGRASRSGQRHLPPDPGGTS